MEEILLIPTYKYLELYQKDFCCDSLNAQLIAMTKERDLLASSLAQALTLVQRLSASNNELEAELKEANKDREDLKGELKDLKDKYAKLQDMHFGNNGNNRGDKDDGHPEKKRISPLLSRPLPTRRLPPLLKTLANWWTRQTGNARSRSRRPRWKRMPRRMRNALPKQRDG